MTVDRRNAILSVVLGIIIIILAIWLVYSIVVPYRAVEQREAVTEHVRERMLNIRDGLIRYKQHYDHFPASEGGLDSLAAFFAPDSMQALRDTIFFTENYGAVQDSIIYSPRPPHKKFEYSRSDSLMREIYRSEERRVGNT